nr:LysR family transcriptional regulator [Microbacterium ulmi]
MQTFVAVVEHGSVIGASRACGYSPAAVSRQMSSLSLSLGVTLFVPQGRSIRPSEKALLLAARARVLLQEAESFDAYARALPGRLDDEGR